MTKSIDSGSSYSTDRCIRARRVAPATTFTHDVSDGISHLCKIAIFHMSAIEASIHTHELSWQMPLAGALASHGGGLSQPQLKEAR